MKFKKNLFLSQLEKTQKDFKIKYYLNLYLSNKKFFQILFKHPNIMNNFGLGLIFYILF